MMQMARRGRFDLHRGLVGLDVEQWCALFDHLAHSHMPGGKGAVGHVHVDLGQDHFDGLRAVGGGCGGRGSVRGRGGWNAHHSLALGVKQGDDGPDRNLVTGFGRDGVQTPGRGGFHLHRGLVGFDVEQRRAFFDQIALSHMPGRKGAMGHVHVHLGQDHFNRHVRPRARSGGGRRPRL